MWDFIVIGGGIAGTSAGARLLRHGSVLLLEAESALGYHASGRSAALYEQSYGLPATIALNRASRADLEAAGVLSPRGFLLVGKAHEAEAMAQDRATMGLAPISVSEARALWPMLGPDVTEAAYHTECWDIDTDKLLSGFARQITDGGGQIHTRAPVQSITRTAQGWQVTTPAGPFEARHLVNAAGAWVDQIAALAGIAPLGFVPKRRSMARIPAPKGLPMATAPIIFAPKEAWYAKPDAGALIVSPADAAPCAPHDAWADDMVLAEGIARFDSYMDRDTPRMIANWAGLRTFAPDGNLVLGPDPQDASFLWCAGQGGYGMQSCAAASAHLAALVGAEPPQIDAQSAAALSPARFAR